MRPARKARRINSRWEVSRGCFNQEHQPWLLLLLLLQQQRCSSCELKCNVTVCVCVCVTCIGYAYSIACVCVSAHSNDAIAVQDSNVCTTGPSKISIIRLPVSWR